MLTICYADMLPCMNGMYEEQVVYVPMGLEAIIFTADGDMRQALNNLQATYGGFGLVNQENVFKVCDQPHPLLVAQIIAHCLAAHIDDADKGMAVRGVLAVGGGHAKARHTYSKCTAVTVLAGVQRNGHHHHGLQGGAQLQNA